MPGLGDIELQRLTPAQPQRLLPRAPRRRPARRQGLAPKTVRNIHAMLHRALKDAVRWGYLVRNVADAADPPRGPLPRAAGLDPRAAAAPSSTMSATTGCTPCGCWSPPPACAAAELAGLRWIDIDFGHATGSPRAMPRVVVNYQVHESDTQDPSGPPLASPSTRPRSRRWRAQRSARPRTAQTVGATLPRPRLVFTWPDGRPLHPENYHRLVPSSTASGRRAAADPPA